MLLTAVTFAENPVFAGLRNAQSPVQPVAADTRVRIASAAAELLARYVKPRNGNHLSERNEGLIRTWTETKGLKIARIAAMPGTQPDSGKGTAASYVVSIDSEMYRTFDKTTNRWSQWTHGRSPYMPLSITVECRTDGTLYAWSKDFTRLIRFTKFGNPESIPTEPQPEIASALTVPWPDAVGNLAPANERQSPPSSSAPVNSTPSIPSFAIKFLVLLFFFAVVVATLLPEVMASPTVKGWLGERMVRGGLQQLETEQYRHFHDLYLPHPTGPGTTQIDHVVVSPFGIFVIETKNYRGWIFGAENQREWTQQIYHHKTRFQNPLFQNQLHVRALMEFLCLPEDRFKSLVFFVGGAEFKTTMPHNVINCGLMQWIKRHSEIRLTPLATENAIACLDQLHRSTDRRTAARIHHAALQTRRAGSLP